MKFIRNIFHNIKQGFSAGFRRIGRFIDAHPMASFFTFLTILLVLIVVSNVVTKPPVVEKKEKVVAKPVQVYRIGSAPKVSLQAQVEKTGVIQITALTGGVVQKIYHKEGSEVKAGTWLVGLSTNYQGGNAFSLQRAIAQKQYKNAEETFPLQMELIAKQKELAEKNDQNADELRKITAKSIDETKAALSLNEDILNTLDQNLKNYEASNSAGQNTQLIFSTKQLKLQYLNANNQLKSALRNSEYSSGDDNPPAAISNISKDIAIKQLELQQKSIELGKEISHLQVKIAKVNEALMYPAAPFAATVQRVHVRVGQAVTPGQVLMTIDCAYGGQLRAIVQAPKEIANKISYIEPSTLHIGNTTYNVHPSFISQEATYGNLYAIMYEIPQDFQNKLTDKGFITVDVPIGYFDTGSVMPFIPLDAIYQTEDQAFVFTENKGKAESTEVMLGEVYGRFVEVKSGIGAGEGIILNRNVIDGEPVVIEQKSL